MASSGSSSVTLQTGRHKFIFEWTLSSQSVANNTSTILCKVYLQSTDQWGALSAPATNNGSMTVNGTAYSWTATSDLSANQKKLLASKSFTITHGSDGTKSFSWSTSYNTNVTYSGVAQGTVTTNGSSTLTTIPRASSMSLSSSSIDFGGSTTISISKKSSGFTSTLRFNWGSSQQTLATKISATSFSFTPDKDLMQYITTAKNGWGTVYCDTYSGSTLVGSVSAKLTINIPNTSEYQPIITSVSLAEANNTVTSAVGDLYIQDKSRIKITTDCSGQGYATISTVSVKIGASTTFTGNPVTTGSINETGDSLPLVVTVTDSRGYISTWSSTIAIKPYSNPTVTMNASRRTDDSSIVDIVWSGKATLIGTANTVGYRVEYKLTSATTWTTKATGSNATTTNWGATTTLSGIDIDKTYDIRVTMFDEFLSVTSSKTMAVATVPMSWGTDGSAVGKVYEEGKAVLQVRKNISIDGNLLIDIFYPVGCIFESTSSTNPSNTMGGTWERFGNGRVLVGVDETDTPIASPNLTGGSTNPISAHTHGPLTGSTMVNALASGSGWASGSSPLSSYAMQTSKTTGSTGNNTDHANWQPYITVHRWRRTA